MALRKLFTGNTAAGAGGKSKMSARFAFASLCKQCVSETFSSLGNGTKTFIFGHNSTDKFGSAVQKLNVLGKLLTERMAQQCNLVAALRLRRAYQILMFYRRLYGERLLFEHVKNNVGLHRKGRPLFALLSATLFEWKEKRVPDEELTRLRDEMQDIHRLVEHNRKKLELETCSVELQEWEEIVNRPHFMVWRKFMPEIGLYTYRVFGHFTDIPPRAFYNTQVDLAYWKDWDPNTIDVQVVDKDQCSSSEVVHWTSKFPYPMAPREYLYVRRCAADTDSNTMVITSKATDHPSVPESESCVRVATYTSQMVIKPYTTFDENGFEYLMTYCDDPKTNFPSVCFKWMASTGVHEFLEKVHVAARKKSVTTRVDNSGDIIYNNNMVH